MSISIESLKEAIHIKETIQNLENRLRQLIGSKPVSTGKRGRPAVLRVGRPRKKRKLSAEGRARIIAAQKKRWGKSGGKPAAAKPAKKRRKLSAEGRARIIAAQKKRWAAQKKSK